MKPLSLSEQFHSAGQRLISASGSDIARELNDILNGFLKWPYKAATGSAIDCQGQRTTSFSSLIYTAVSGGPVAEAVAVSADTMACAIDVLEIIDLEKLRVAYANVVSAKKIKKAPAPDTKGVAHTTVTLGIILATRSTVPLEVLAEELEHLNENTPSNYWPDMVAILTEGIVNYGVQIPGEHTVSGDFLPPADGALANYIPAIYVIIVIKPSGSHSFNKMMAFLIAHLAIFSPGANLPNWTEILEGAPNTAMTLTGYQYNLRGELVPVPRQFYNDRYLAPLPLRIEDRRGRVLSTLQFMPWQDGGVILLRGKLPLEGLLVFLGAQALQRMGVIKRGDLQISHVLPISSTDFDRMVQGIQQRSNMIVRNDPTKLIMQKIADEGASSPFMARLFIGILKLGDAAYRDQPKRAEFATAYRALIMTLINIRATTQDIIRLLDEHTRRVADGDIVRIQGQSIQISESIDRELRKHVEDFLNGATRAIKQGTQRLTKVLGFEIGFLYQKPNVFQRGLASLGPSDARLADYLREVRQWSERLVQARNALEHDGWMLPSVGYSDTAGSVQVDEPHISGQRISEFAKFMLDRLMCFIEEVTVHCLQAQMPHGISVTEIPSANRAPEIPARFQVTLAAGGMPVWNIGYHQSSFEEV